MDIGAAYDVMARITYSASSVTKGMNALLDYTAQAQPSAMWEVLRRLDYEEDAAALRAWLRQVLTEEPPPQGVRAYWFGIFNPVVDEEVSCAFYVSGPTEDYTPDTLDWACWTDETYLPQDRYAPSPVLHALYRAAQGVDGAELLGEYTLCLGYACLAVAEVMRSLDPVLFLGDADERPVAVGFDEGDGLPLGTVTNGGWRQAEPGASSGGLA